MKRWHEETALMVKRMKLEREKHGVDPDNRDGTICHCLLGIGFVRKRRPYDCGNPRCGLCHHDKYYGKRPSRDQMRQRVIRYELEAEGVTL